MKKITRLTITALTGFFFVASLLLLIMGTMAVQQDRYVKIFNHSYSVVGSGSMEPTIMTGEFIIIRYDSYDSVLQKVLEGETPIIAFRGDRNIVHRAIGIDDETGKIITKGDNNPSRDDLLIDESNYIGIVVSHFMLLDVGSLTLNYRNIVFLLLIIVLLFILLKEFYNIVKLINEKKRIEMLEKHEQEKAKWIESEKERLRKELEVEMKNKKTKKTDQ
jgi:signal peptidase I